METIPYWLVTIQQAEDTGLFHPTLYRVAPWPGGVDIEAVRYQSVAHHTEGFADLWAARKNAQRLLAHYHLSLPPGGVRVEQVASAGPSQVILSRSAL